MKLPIGLQGLTVDLLLSVMHNAHSGQAQGGPEARAKRLRR